MDKSGTAPPPSLLDSLSELHRQMVAEGVATLHRFAAEPRFKHGLPVYRDGTLPAVVERARARRGR